MIIFCTLLIAITPSDCYQDSRPDCETHEVSDNSRATEPDDSVWVKVVLLQTKVTSLLVPDPKDTGGVVSGVPIDTARPILFLSSWWSAFCCFGILAWCSLAYVILWDPTADGTAKPREYLWDMAKFILICFVWFNHGGLPGDSFYKAWFMPAFFFLSGLNCAAPELNSACVRKVAMSVLRDHVLNIILYSLLVYALSRGGCPDPFRPWFLYALGMCRIFVPVCFYFTLYMGEISGSFVFVAIAVLLPYLLSNEFNFWPNPAVPCRNDEIVFWLLIWQSIPYYAFGFVTDRNALAKQLKTCVAICVSFVIVVTLFCLGIYGVIQFSDIVPEGDRKSVV